MKIFVAGHRGMVGSAIVRRLVTIGADIVTRDRAQLDLLDRSAVAACLLAERPDMVVLAAAKVGGIAANNDYPAEFIYENLLIEANVIHESFRAGIGQLLFLGSSCIYPRMAPQPIPESALLTGPLEPTNEPYAMAKLAGIKLCESYNRQYGVDYRSIMPTNLYGPGDNFHPTGSHVLPALLRRFHEAKLAGLRAVTIWGTGTPRREFLHVDDMADASVFMVKLPIDAYRAETLPMQSHINVGTGVDISIADLARMIGDVVGFDGAIEFDASKPDGTPRKLLDVGKLSALGWTYSIPLLDGIEATYRWYLDHGALARR
jgi:GDP-L-fucose synthase